MTRAGSEQSKYVPWFAKAGSVSSIVAIARFVSDHIFALKGGSYSCLFSLSGIDEEGVTDQELESHLRMIEGALRGMPGGACLARREVVNGLAKLCSSFMWLASAGERADLAEAQKVHPLLLQKPKTPGLSG